MLRPCFSYRVHTADKCYPYRGSRSHGTRVASEPVDIQMPAVIRSNCRLTTNVLHRRASIFTPLSALYKLSNSRGRSMSSRFSISCTASLPSCVQEHSCFSYSPSYPLSKPSNSRCVSLSYRDSWQCVIIEVRM